MILFKIYTCCCWLSLPQQFHSFKISSVKDCIEKSNIILVDKETFTLPNDSNWNRTNIDTVIIFRDSFQSTTNKECWEQQNIHFSSSLQRFYVELTTQVERNLLLCLHISPSLSSEISLLSASSHLSFITNKQLKNNLNNVLLYVSASHPLNGYS